MKLLKTERCVLRSFQEEDFFDAKKLFVDQKVRRYLGGIRQEDSIQAILDEMLHPRDDSYYWVIRETETGEFIGLISLDPHHDSNDIEISYQILPEWWGAGYATEVVQEMIDYAFNELNLSKIIAETQTANLSSYKLLERVGMKFEKTVTRYGDEQAIYSIQSI
ncbi:GNAT family N-acetyltransferase [Neobacillus jeddahensis]|uniref:GNAT family N-acetyltransferase n=1 Tax=Neobacillus jeddahensis TaxID=1461580 RepID=UPI001FCC399E|nr:GNAT family N-acetyltransferase [Neobacillus jeddahensis]